MGNRLRKESYSLVVDINVCISSNYSRSEDAQKIPSLRTKIVNQVSKALKVYLANLIIKAARLPFRLFVNEPN